MVAAQEKNLNVFVLWQSLVVDAYRSFFYQLANLAPWRIALAAPRKFRELGSQMIVCAPFEAPFARGGPVHSYSVLPAASFHVQAVHFLGLGGAMRAFFRGHSGPRVFLCIAEPYSITAFLAWWTARAVLGRSFIFVCYAAQNIDRRLSWPLACLQAFVFTRTGAILAVGKEQESVLRRSGYTGVCLSYPLWYDARRFQGKVPTAGKLTVGFAGSLVPEKGVLDLLQCAAEGGGLAASAALRVVGSGPLSGEVAARCAALVSAGIDARFSGALPAAAMPDFYRELDVLVVPSRTTPNWKEQFGRVIIEAAASGVVVVGSDSGEIPQVIGIAERIFPEGDLESMRRVINAVLVELTVPAARSARRQKEAARAAAAYSDSVLAAKFCESLSALASAVTARGERSA